MVNTTELHPDLQELWMNLCHRWKRRRATLVRALAHIDSFERGTNLSAWMFTILRNLFRSQYRKRMREVDYDEESHVVNNSTDCNTGSSGARWGSFPRSTGKF